MVTQKATVTRLLQPKLAAVLTECREKASTSLLASLRAVLDRVDDALFELANRADSSHKQNRYFDAMRELRIKRETFEAAFFDSFDAEFEHVMAPESNTQRTEATTDPEPELALLATDEVEESLAVTNLVESLRVRCRQELFALDKRIGFLLSDPDLGAASNPLGPYAISHAFRAACRQLQSDIEVKLTLFKLFDRFGSSGVLQLYRDINQRLVEHAILPKISASAPRAGSRHRTRVIIESESDSAQAAGDDVFSTLQQLMLAREPYGAASAAGAPLPYGGHAPVGSGNGPGAVGGAPSGAAGSGGSGPLGGFWPCYGGVLAATAHDAGYGCGGTGGHFVQTLTQLQQGDVSGIGETALTPAVITAGNVNVLRTLRDSGMVRDLNHGDSLTLEIVSILFDYILDDPSIPDTMKALIGRLQIPLLKVALVDKELFSRKSHPARRLLDALAAAALGWTDVAPHHDALYEMVDRTVRRIIDEFEDDIALFETVLADFLAFVDAEEAAASRCAAASAESLDAKERVTLAKLAVDDAVKQCLGAGEVREFVRRFVLDYWRQLLVITHVEHGPDSEQWRDQLQAVEELVWSVQPKTTGAERKDLTGRLPRLIKTIKAGMQALEMDPAECSKVLSMLASVHVVSVKNREEEITLAERRLQERRSALAAAADTPGEQAPGATAEPARAESADEDPEEFIKQGLSRLFERKGLAQQELDIDFSILEAPEQPREDASLDAGLAGYLELVTTLDLGDWVEFRQEDGGTVRGRFTWISPATGRYLFTTRTGRKAMDTTLYELAEEFRRGTVRKLDAPPDPLFDRAIGDLMERLERQSARSS